MKGYDKSKKIAVDFFTQREFTGFWRNKYVYMCAAMPFFHKTSCARSYAIFLSQVSVLGRPSRRP
jgi:hypothetical protein